MSILDQLVMFSDFTAEKAKLSSSPTPYGIPVAGASGVIVDEWLTNNIPRQNSDNVFTKQQTINSDTSNVVLFLESSNGIKYTTLDIKSGDGESPRVAGIRLTDGSTNANSRRWEIRKNDTNGFEAFYFSSSGTTSRPFLIDPEAKSNSLIIKSSGYVGIGTSSPTALFHVSTGSDVPANVSDGPILSVTNSFPGGGSGLDYRDGVIGIGVSVPHVHLCGGALFTNNTRGRFSVKLRTDGGVFNERFNIDYLGRVGIGVTNPTTLLAVNGTSSFTGAASFSDNITLSPVGSSDASPRTIEIPGNIAGARGRIAVAGEGNSLQGGNGQKTQFSSYWGIELRGDRRTSAPSFVDFNTDTDISVAIFSPRAATRPLVIEGASGQSTILTGWRDYNKTYLSAINSAGGFLAPAGSASNPSVSFIGDQNTGFYNTASNDTIGAAVGGVQQCWINSGGFVVHQTGSTVRTELSTTHNLYISNTGTGGAGYRVIATNNLYAAGGERLVFTPTINTVDALMTFYQGNKVGIGTLTPTQTLTVQGDAAFYFQPFTSGSMVSMSLSSGLVIRDTVGSVGISLINTADSTGRTYNILSSSNINAIGGGKLGIVYNNSSSANAILTIDGANNRIGLGQSNVNPTSILDVGGNTIRTRFSRTVASASAAGNQGEHSWDDYYEYRCVNTNSWQRLIRNAQSTFEITADVNNYAPQVAKTWRLYSSAARNITGLSTGAWGRDEHQIVNVGANNITLKHQNSNSTEANRFLCSTGADIVLAPNEMAFLWYDSVLPRWRVYKY